MTKIHSPHDKFFKASMRNVEVAREHFAAHLPPEILKRVDLSTLTLCPDSFIDTEFKWRAVDIVYQVKIDDRIGYFYLLAEHQSTVDELLPFRLMIYIFLIMDKHLDIYKTNELPIVYPMVLYNGQNEYTGTLDIFHLFGPEEELARKILLQPFQLIDLTKLDPKELKQRPWSGMMEMLLRHARLRDYRTDKRVQRLYNTYPKYRQ